MPGVVAGNFGAVVVSRAIYQYVDAKLFIESRILAWQFTTNLIQQLRTQQTHMLSTITQSTVDKGKGRGWLWVNILDQWKNAWLDRVSNEDIRWRLGVEAVLALRTGRKRSGERGLKECHRRGWWEEFLRRICAKEDREDGKERSG